MGTFESVLDNTTLQTMYTTAKINADRYNYTLKTRALLIEKSDLKQCDIFNLSCQTERALCSVLPEKQVEYTLNPKLPFLQSHIIFTQEFTVPEETCGYMYLFNNLNVNIEALVSDFYYINTGNTGMVKIPLDFSKSLVDHKILESLMYFYSKCTSQDSLIPYLFYLLTESHHYTLDDLTSNKHIYDVLTKGQIFDIEHLDLLYSSSPYSEHVNIGRAVSGRQLLNKHSIDFEAYRMGIYQTLIYGCEILYQYSTIDNSLNYKDIIAKYFSHYASDDSSIVGTHLYTVNESEGIIINPKLDSCFVSNPNDRFELFKQYLDDIFKDTFIVDLKNLYTKLESFKVPLVFAKFVNQMHHYAVQKFRVNYVVFLYSLVKDRKLLDELKISYVSGMPLPTSDDVNIEYEDSFDLLPLVTTKYEDLSKDKENPLNVEKESSIIKLDEIETLKKDNSIYDYDVKIIHSSDTEMDTYFKIANSVKMLTHNLSKQIKDIKVYNFGGKNPGLYTGKLDRKNLYKYKTDPKIFYNNTYKTKEMDLAFGCILDESGSMYGTSIENGRIVMILLHEVLTSLGINHSIIGHTSSNFHQCTINKYYHFKEEKAFSIAKPYSLAKITSKYGNCDSGALHYMEKSLNKVKNKDKIVLIFSDGEPTECTDLELKKQIASMESKGIHVIGIGINFSSIAQYYPDHANGKNLTEMINIIVSILKRYVLEKED